MRRTLKATALMGLLTFALLGASCAVNENMRPHSKTTPDGNNSPQDEQPQVGTEMHLIRYEYKKGELEQLCDTAIEKARKRLDGVAALGAQAQNFEVSVMGFEAALADLTDETGPLVFMAYVSTDDALREEGSNCEEKVGQFSVSIFTRQDLYQTIKGAIATTSDQKRLLTETLKAFEKNGLKLQAEKLAKVRELKKELASLEAKFSENLNNDKSTITFTAEELSGVSESFLSRLKKTEDGNAYIVTTKSTDYLHVMENAKNGETRRKMLVAYLNRAGQANPPLLEKAVVLRQQIAQLMGYRNWVDYRTDGRMAQNAKNVNAFLTGLQAKLALRKKADLRKLLDYKKTIEPGAKKLEMWDLAYMAYQLKKRDYSLDDELVREYFPADYVVKGMFEVYSEILGVRYEQVEGAKVWHPDVKLYKVINKSDGKLLSYFFADMIPRPGKYGHAAAFPLIMGRAKADGYSYPVSSIVSNFNPPSGSKPSLLNIDEVETLFHEFGHIMHQILTRAPFASLSGTSVAQDFVEAPSQMLENWVWDSSILNRISGHYKNTSQKLPPELLQKILAAKDFNQGYFYTRQLFLGLMDYTMHTAKGPVNSTALHDRLYKKIIGIDPVAGNHFNATFGHLMGGYDAGYYGYLWSEVYAQDMFTVFKEKGLLDATTGGRYRSIILEKGNMKEPLELVTEFLGRKPSTAAFYEKLGIKP